MVQLFALNIEDGSREKLVEYDHNAFENGGFIYASSNNNVYALHRRNR